jgi:3-dehydroquinate synthase
VKSKIVAADERESGDRALLNFGHTFGHAIETGIGYGEWLHGEAVAAGMVVAAKLSERLGWIEADDVARLAALLESAKLPIAPPRIPVAQWLTLLGRDKKVSRGALRLVLLRALGRAVITADFDHDALEAVLRA